MNVCLIIASFWPGWGGAENQCRLLCRELSRRGHAVAVLTRGSNDAPATEVVSGAVVTRIPAPGHGLWQSAVWTLAATAWLRKHRRRFQVLLCYQLLSPAHVGILGQGGSAGPPVIVRPACSGPFGDVAEVRRLPFTRLRRRLLARADAFVTLSGEIEAELAAFGLGRVPCHRIPNGVDLEVFRPASMEEKRALRVRLGLPENRVLCVFAGRLTPQKNPGLLLEAWAMGRWPDAHLVLVGDGPLRPRLHACVTSGPNRDQVSFAGATADVAPYLKAADLLVLPSRAEGMSNVILEAMACGLPIVATDVPGNREVVGEDGKAGLLVPPESPGALAKAVADLMAAPALRRELGMAGRARILEQFDIHRIGARYLSLYEELSG